MVVFEAVFIVGYYKMQTLSHQTLCYRSQRWEKIGDIQHLDKATTSESSGRRAGRAIHPNGKLQTIVLLCPGTTGYHAAVMDAHHVLHIPSMRN